METTAGYGVMTTEQKQAEIVDSVLQASLTALIRHSIILSGKERSRMTAMISGYVSGSTELQAAIALIVENENAPEPEAA